MYVPDAVNGLKFSYPPLNIEVSGQAFPEPSGAMDGGGRAYRDVFTACSGKACSLTNARTRSLGM